MFVSCLNAGPPYEARIYYLYSATLTGTYTWYNNGSGIDDSFVLGLGTSGQPDEGAWTARASCARRAATRWSTLV